MRVFKVPDTLAHKYRGAGCALAAITGNQLIDIKYLRDIFPDTEVDASTVRELLDSPMIAPFVRELQMLGEVSVGMLSAWEFCEV